MIFYVSVTVMNTLQSSIYRCSTIFELDEASKDLCTIVTPFGKFRYNILLMGLKCSTDFAQEVMENIFHDLEDTNIYIDDVGAFSKTWEHHIKLLDTVLH